MQKIFELAESHFSRFHSLLRCWWRAQVVQPRAKTASAEVVMTWIWCARIQEPWAPWGVSSANNWLVWEEQILCDVAIYPQGDTLNDCHGCYSSHLMLSNFGINCYNFHNTVSSVPFRHINSQVPATAALGCSQYHQWLRWHFCALQGFTKTALPRDLKQSKRSENPNAESGAVCGLGSSYKLCQQPPHITSYYRIDNHLSTLCQHMQNFENLHKSHISGRFVLPFASFTFWETSIPWTTLHG